VIQLEIHLTIFFYIEIQSGGHAYYIVFPIVAYDGLCLVHFLLTNG
jgi:hypothetical protein